MQRFLVAAILAAAALTPRASIADGASWKNLQVLPKDMKKDDLKRTMKAMAKALGVECDHCHDMPDAAKDTENKKIARQMLVMTRDINEKYIKDPKAIVSCATCHRGHEKPDVLMEK